VWRTPLHTTWETLGNPAHHVPEGWGMDSKMEVGWIGIPSISYPVQAVTRAPAEPQIALVKCFR